MRWCDTHGPGNIRELQNFIERAVILSPQSTLRAPTFELEPFQPQRGQRPDEWSR